MSPKSQRSAVAKVKKKKSRYNLSHRIYLVMQKLEREAKKWMEEKRKGKIICPKCDTEMIQGGDHDAEVEDEDDFICSNFSCNTCDTFLLLYWR